MKTHFRKHFLFIFSLLFSLLSTGVFAQFSDEDRFDSGDPDIQTIAHYDDGYILFKFDMADNYHITDLKYGFFKIEITKNEFLEIQKSVFPKGVPYADEMAFKGQFDVKVFVKALKPIPQPQTVKFKVSYQLCREKPDDMCFAPTHQDIDFRVEKEFKTATNREKSDDESYSQWIERIIKEELKHQSFLLFFLVFIAGFLTSLTPCVYPIIPIVMGYIGTRSGKKKLKGLYLSIFFVLGLALVYSILGVIAATTGTMMGVSFQNPAVVIAISSIFFIMGLSLAGFFEIPVPASLSSKIQGGHKSEIIGSLVVGGVSGIIAAPCVGPVLIALLSWISQTGNIMLGFWLTFTFSMGLGVIFLVVGTFSGMISAMPKGGTWMEYVKYFFALLLMAGGLYLLDAIMPPWINLLLWGIFLVSATTFMGLFKPLTDHDPRQKTFKSILVLLFLLGTLLFFKAIETRYFPTVATTAVHGPAESELTWIPSLEQGKEIAKNENKTLMIDTYADWCVACKELEKHTFSDPTVTKRLKELVLVKLDFTKNTTENEAMRKSLGVIGMPTIIFLDPQGNELKRFSGFKKKGPFMDILDGLAQ